MREVLGQGGMGTVYLAEHAVIGKKVAIKVLKRDLAGHDTLVARFINEARAYAVVGHAGIVEVFDVGTLPSGVPYLVMEYLKGENLGQRIARVGRLQVEDATQIAWETASALGAAHAKGIIHRDLKPENLFLARDSGNPDVERVKVLDFGIAKLHADPNQVHTQTGAVMGTPAYMSPEQCRGARDEVDQRTDIYSLGIILYQMLCGKPPFVGDAFGDMLMRHMTEAVVPPRQLNPEVPDHLEQAVLCALAKRREERFNSMRDFQAGLAGTGQTMVDRTPAPLHRPPSIGTLTPPLSSLTPPVHVNARATSNFRLKVSALVVGGVLVLGGVIALLSARRPASSPVAIPVRQIPSSPRVEPLPSRPASSDAAAAMTGELPDPLQPVAGQAAKPSGPPAAPPAGRKRPRPGKTVGKSEGKSDGKIDVKQW